MGTRFDDEAGSNREESESTDQINELEKKINTAKSKASRRARQSEREPQEKAPRSRRKTTEEKEREDFIRLGESSGAPPKIDSKQMEQEAEQIADFVIMGINNFAVMYAKSPEAAMNELERLFIQGPLQQWLSVPAVYNKVAKHMTPVMVLVGMSIYAIRVNLVRGKMVAEAKAAARLEVPEPTVDFTSNEERAGKVNPDTIMNGQADPQAQHEFFTSDEYVTASSQPFTSSLYSE